MKAFRDSLADPAFLSLAAKKAKMYVLKFNTYASPIEVDTFFAEFNKNIEGIAEQFRTGTYSCSPMLPVQAPKGIERSLKMSAKQRRDGWEEDKGTGQFIKHMTRVLAHVSFRDQVVGAALLMALGDKYESQAGDTIKESYPKLIAFGNRLFISPQTGKFPIGSNLTYRFWAEDYSRFVQETSKVFNSALKDLPKSRRLFLLSSDISNFYPSIKKDVLISVLKT